MILVSGTGRSGTSMWMQILAQAGLPVVGESFPGNLTLLHDANPRGFFESTLIRGINFTTNPDPESGVEIRPETSQDLVIKVFLQGLRQTEFLYLNRVLVTTREWRAFSASVKNLEAMQDRESRPLPQSGRIDEPAIKWWLDHYFWIQDQRRRGFNAHWLSYESVLEDSQTHIAEVLDWIGQPCDREAAMKAVEPRLRTQQTGSTPSGLKPDWIEAFDELYYRVHTRQNLDTRHLKQMETITQDIQAELGPRDAWK